MAYKRTKTVEGGTKTKTRSRVRKDGTTVTKTKTKSAGTKSKSRSVVGKKKTTTEKTSLQVPLPDSTLKGRGGTGKRTGVQTKRTAIADTTTKTTSQSGKAKSKTKVRGKGKVKTSTQGTRSNSTSTTSLRFQRGNEALYDSQGRLIRDGGYVDTETKGATPLTTKTSKAPKTRTTKVRGKFSRDIPLPKSNF